MLNTKETDNKELLKKLFNLSSEAVCLTSLDGLILKVNDLYAKYCETEEQNILGGRCRDFLNSQNCDKDECSLKRVLRGEKEMCGEVAKKNKNGENKYYSFRAIAFTDLDNNLIGVLQSFKDITETKKLEMKLKQYAGDLVVSNAEKDKMISIIAHDLKNPINSIIGFSNLLRKNQKKYSVEKTEKMLRLINDGSKRANILLENVLEWAMMQSGRVDFVPETINVNNIIDEELRFADVSSELKNIKVNNLSQNNQPIIIVADGNMLKTVVRNLISNAIKYTHENGCIDVSAKIDDDEMHIIVKDNGIGISKDNVERLFFVENMLSNPGTNNEMGTGFGLLLCKEFVERNNGEISVESEEGKGSVFTVSLPMNGEN